MFTKVYLGTTSISKIFLGDMPIKYSKEQPPAPSNPQELLTMGALVDSIPVVEVPKDTY